MNKRNYEAVVKTFLPRRQLIVQELFLCLHCSLTKQDDFTYKHYIVQPEKVF